MALMGGAYDILGANGLKEDAAHNQPVTRKFLMKSIQGEVQ